MDDEGMELASPHAARAHAIKGARDLMAEMVRHGYLSTQDRIEIVDVDQKPVDTVFFYDAVDIKR